MLDFQLALDDDIWSGLDSEMARVVIQMSRSSNY